MNIEVDIGSDTSINDAISQLEDFKDQFDEAVKTFVRRVGELGVTVVTAAYDQAWYAGKNDITVRLIQNENGCVIHAEGGMKDGGATLGFIEFGTGIAYPLGVSAAEVGAPAHGTFGQGQGNNPWGWVYEGDPGNLGRPLADKPGLVHTRGNPPANAFDSAKKAIVQNVQQIAQEVFGT